MLPQGGGTGTVIARNFDVSAGLVRRLALVVSENTNPTIVSGAKEKISQVG